MNLMTPAAAGRVRPFGTSTGRSNSPSANQSSPIRAPEEEAACILKAAERILTGLERGLLIEARLLRQAMEEAFGGSDAEGFWTWKAAYEACEAAQVLFLRKYGRAMREKAGSPAAQLAMLSRIAGLLPTHTRRTQESEEFQQFSTPMPLAYAASIAAASPAMMWCWSRRPARGCLPSSPRS